jgi:hypothetical protein
VSCYVVNTTKYYFFIKPFDRAFRESKGSV